MQVRLEVARNKANVKKVVLRSDVVIGRSPECNLRIASNEVSRQHCKLFVTPSGVLVRDLGSSNGTFVNGTRVEPETDVPVAPGAQLSVGGVEFIVRYELPDAAEADNRADEAAETPAAGMTPLAAGQVATQAAPEPEPATDTFFAADSDSGQQEHGGHAGHWPTDTLDFPDTTDVDPSGPTTPGDVDAPPAPEPQTKRRSLFGLFGRKKAKDEPAEADVGDAPAASEPAEPFDDSAHGADSPSPADPADDFFGTAGADAAGEQSPDEDEDLGDFLKQLGQ